MSGFTITFRRAVAQTATAWCLLSLLTVSACGRSMSSTHRTVPPTPTAPAAVALVGVPKGHRVRLKVADSLLEGRMHGVVGDTVRVEIPPLWAIPAANIDSAWARSNNAGTGALIGAALIGLVGAQAGATHCNLTFGGFGNQDCRETFSDIAGGFILGAMVGAGAGAIIGSVVGRWKRVYP